MLAVVFVALLAVVSAQKDCTSFCTDYLATCNSAVPAGFPVYTDAAGCMAECNAWPVDPSCLDGVNATLCGAGNSWGCRRYHLNVAMTDAASAATHCPHATPLGPFTTDLTAANALTGPCTTASDTAKNIVQNGLLDEFCDNLITTCGQYLTTSIDQCLSTFRYLPGAMDASYQPNGTTKFPLTNPTSGFNMPCRGYHLTVARSNPAAHCVHAVTGDDACGSNCDAFCALVMGACTGTNVQYSTTAACMTACGAWPATNATMITSGNSVFCRFYHASVASTSASNAATHCPHAGPAGSAAGQPCAAAVADDDSAFTASVSFFLVALLAFLALML
jgi:hypothetical protein